METIEIVIVVLSLFAGLYVIYDAETDRRESK